MDKSLFDYLTASAAMREHLFELMVEGKSPALSTLMRLADMDSAVFDQE
jgi:hypothetical protein